MRRAVKFVSVYELFNYSTKCC